MSKTAQRKITAERDGQRDALAQRKPQHTTERNYPFIADYRRGYRNGLKRLKLQQEDVKIVGYENVDVEPPISIDQALANLQKFGVKEANIKDDESNIMDGDWSYPEQAA
jgi:hypothetical protein